MLDPTKCLEPRKTGGFVPVIERPKIVEDMNKYNNRKYNTNPFDIFGIYDDELLEEKPMSKILSREE